MNTPASFLERVRGHAAAHADRACVIEVHGERTEPTTFGAIAELAAQARTTLDAHSVAPGERVGLLAPNSARWVAADLALLDQGAIVVPLYARQDPHELAGMLRDSGATLVLCATPELEASLKAAWPDGRTLVFDALFAADPSTAAPAPRAAADPVTIIYTSGTSGEPKGVVLTLANIDFMLPVVAAAIDDMMTRAGNDTGLHRVFHYLPFCFAGSRMVLWVCLYRANPIHASTDLTNLVQELGTAKPNYFLNVPALLERVKNGVEQKIRTKPKPIQWLYDGGKAAFWRIADGKAGALDTVKYGLAKKVVYGKIAKTIGPELACLICGSAPLGEDTQRWFEMLGLPVYQVYGLTETTAIVTMDRPGDAAAGLVGFPIAGVEVRLGEGDELQVRGPNIFSSYWNREAATADAMTEDGWFRTGDKCALDSAGRLQVIGRVKNLLVPSSGHNVAPEPIEQQLVETIEGVEQAVVIGHARPHLTAIITGQLDKEALAVEVARVNAALPHYRRIRNFHLSSELFTPENGLLTANQKLKRASIAAHYAKEIDQMYAQ